jgi:hypothetical protein
MDLILKFVPFLLSQLIPRQSAPGTHKKMTGYTPHEVQGLKDIMYTWGGCPGSSSPFPANVMRVPSFHPGCTSIVMTSCSHALPVNPPLQYNAAQ